MKPEERRIVFNRATYLLNAVFPQQQDGKPMHNQWRDCESYFRQAAALLENYNWLKDDIGQPIMLCEVAARCAWYVIQDGSLTTILNLDI